MSSSHENRPDTDAQEANRKPAVSGDQPECGLQNDPICTPFAIMLHVLEAAPNGGSRAATVASDDHAARPPFQSVSEPSAESERELNGICPVTDARILFVSACPVIWQGGSDRVRIGPQLGHGRKALLRPPRWHRSGAGSA
jgi:hypothetical protein